MRAYKKLGKRGFTLVELMIVVAIIGVLAALAIYGVRRYLASSKTSEAKQTIGAISRGATAAYERETTSAENVAEGVEGAASTHALCGTVAKAVPNTADPPAGKKYQPNTKEGEDYETTDTLNGWKCLKFGLNQPHYYQYNYAKGASVYATSNPAKSTADGYEAAAKGDLDGDKTFSLFARTGEVNLTTKQLKASTQVYAENEFE